jgi:hypothetical protein
VTHGKQLAYSAYDMIVGYLGRWFQHPPSDRIQRRNEGRAYALLLGNILLTIAVFICFAFKLQPGQTDYKLICHGERCFGVVHNLPGPAFSVFLIFVAAEIGSVALYLFNAFWPENYEERLGEGLVLERSDYPDPTPGDKRKGFLIPLWVTVIPNAFAIGYLSYKTGGPSNSPYAQVLVAILVVAQQVKWVPPSTAPRKSRTFNFIPAMIEYRFFLLVAFIFYVPLVLLQIFLPADVSPAPAGLSVGVTVIVFAFSTYITYLLDIAGRGEKGHEMPVSA